MGKKKKEPKVKEPMVKFRQLQLVRRIAHNWLNDVIYLNGSMSTLKSKIENVRDLLFSHAVFATAIGVAIGVTMVRFAPALRELHPVFYVSAVCVPAVLFIVCADKLKDRLIEMDTCCFTRTPSGTALIDADDESE